FTKQSNNDHFAYSTALGTSLRLNIRYSMDLRSLQLLSILLVIHTVVFCASTEPIYDVDPDPVVKTKLGRVRGTVHYAINSTKPVYAFYNIRYAEPPTHYNRFAKPTAARGWSGVRDATKLGHSCIENDAFYKPFAESYCDNRIPTKQRFDIYSEDCLQLDVFTPNTKGKLPVMFWIHGGGLSFGSGHTYNGTALCTFTDLVVVSINYRTGHLGFLNSGDNQIPGNMGFLDQQMALKWTSENIHAFGGDPDRITIAGEGAGSWSVSAHLVSHGSKPLFKRAILQSGSILTDKLINDNPKERFDETVEKLDCKYETVMEQVQCLRMKSVEDIKKIGNGNMYMDWATVDGGQFFLEHPKDLYAKTDFSDKEVMVGVAEQEGYTFFQGTGDTQVADYTYAHFLDEIKLGLSMLMKDDALTNKHLEKIAKMYFKDNHSPKVESLYKVKAVDIVGDFNMAFPALNLTDTIKANGGKTFFYVFTHDPSFIQPKRPEFVVSTHFDDVFFMFGTGFLDIWVDEEKGYVFNEAEQEFSKQMMQYWANFAATGNPNDGDLPHWPEYDLEEEEFAILKPRVSRSQMFSHKKYQFWKKFMANIEKQRLKAKEQKEKDEL
ncbi:unnamed protein product, partial [Owenia fusiformis]